MGTHLVAWYGSLDQASIAPIPAVADPSITVSGNNIQVPDFAPNLVFACGIGPSLTRAQIQSPSLRRIAHYEILPVATGTTFGVTSLPPFRGESPIPLDAGEQVQAYASENGAGATAMYVFALLADGAVTPVNGEIYTVRVTSATTLSVNNWTNGTLVFDQQLPVGRYAIVGAHFYGTNLLAYRFVFQGSTPRPGGIAVSSANFQPFTHSRFGAWGVWGEFSHNTPPTVDFFGVAADTSQVGVLDLIKTG